MLRGDYYSNRRVQRFPNWVLIYEFSTNDENIRKFIELNLFDIMILINYYSFQIAKRYFEDPPRVE